MTVTITDDTTRADLATTLDILNAEAKKQRRRGYVGIYGPEYAAWHQRIDAVITDYWLAEA